MKSFEKDVKDVGKVEFVEFDSLQDFKNYITNTPVNNAFKGERLSSNKSDSYFSKTSSFDEAINLFTDGWTSMSTEINNKLSVGHGAMINERAMQRVLSVQGFQPVVPLYLSGVPQNMVSTRFKPMKKKVIIIDKDVCYSAAVTSDEIVKESVKALAVVKKLESQNYRVNLNIVFCPESYGKSFCFKIKIKSSNERLNVGKMSFPLVHPSMLRRLLFRLEEVHPTITRNFVGRYGRPMSQSDVVKCFKDDFVLPRFIDVDINNIKDVDDLYKNK